MCTLTDHLLHHLTHERSPINRSVLCRELERIGLASETVPCAPQWEWMEALVHLVAAGDVCEAGMEVWVDRERLTRAVIASRQAIGENDGKPAPSQATLF